MDEENIIHLALAFDQNFIIPFYVTITSILENNKKNTIFFHVIATGISEEEQQKIEYYVAESNANIKFYKIDLALAESFPISSPHFTAATYYRLFFPALVPANVQRLLYLDVDIVVNKDLLKFYELEIGNFVLAAALDPGMKVRPELNIVQHDSYFNAGVLLINIEKWRRLNITDKAIQYIIDYPERILHDDQDALNAVLINNWFRIDKKLNLQRLSVPNVSREHLKSFIEGVVIIHYTSYDKPWNRFCTHPLKYLYDFYLSKSPKSILKQYSGLKLAKHLVISYFANSVVSFYTSNPAILNAWRRLRS
ncbi:MAG: glycosyltransferase family 8 protein [Hymenobacter sp.]|nr:MAG: glycosyltransferase family 8 protein [Hymenobacter sp.]